MYKLHVTVLLNIITALTCKTNEENICDKVTNTPIKLHNNLAMDWVFQNKENVYMRKRRHLVFQKGAMVMFQGNIGKAIVSGRPRGLNILMEYTLMYELPTSSAELFTHRKPTMQVKTTTKTKPIPKSLWQNASYHSSHGYKFNGVMMQKRPQFQLKRTQQQQHLHQKLCFPRENVYAHFHNNTYRTRVLERSKVQIQNAKNSARYQRIAGSDDDGFELKYRNIPERILFDIISTLAQMHGYNARHCVMRTLCEFKHLLWQPGVSLFHDLLRILINYSLPIAYEDYAYKQSMRRGDLNECIHLYGLHCRISFIQHFTNVIHGRFM